VSVDGGSFGIDATEVTECQYAHWLATNPSTTAQRALCAWNSSFAPDVPLAMFCDGTFDPVHDPTLPVVCVDWCDAVGYCEAQGGRLCGKIGSGSNGFNDFANASLSQWFAACSVGGMFKYPYGNTYDGSACVGYDYDGVPGYQAATDVVRPVGSATRCHAAPPLNGLFDMSGNVDEWEDGCQLGSFGTVDQCPIRGGDYFDNFQLLACDAALQHRDRSGMDPAVGFRCCHD
jgi:formylglycine-generating enzyme required for sulfatase activity